MSTDSSVKAVHDVLVIRGVLAILFGIAAVFWPGLTLVTLVYLFSAFVLIDGLVNIVSSITASGKKRHWFLSLVLGLFEVGVGVYLLRHPTVSFATLILLISFSLIIMGLVGGVGALFADDETATSKTFQFIIGAAAVVVGIVMLFQPAASGVAFVWLLGLYALVAGALQIALAADVNKLK